MNLISLSTNHIERIKNTLSTIESFLKISSEISKVHSPKESYVNYLEIFDPIYVLFTGETREEVVNGFRGPNSNEKEKVCAWITKDSLYPLTGYIPDSIDGLILNTSIDLNLKIKHLRELFILLKDLEENSVSNPITSEIKFSYSPKLISR